MKLPHKQALTYSRSGVDYQAVDRWKRKSQILGTATAPLLKLSGSREIGKSRGESAYVWEENGRLRAIVIEGLGTKNLVADEMSAFSRKPYYRGIAQDTVAMIVNDLITVGAMPLVVNAYFAVGSFHWFDDRKRADDLIEGWSHACRMSGASWGGGETPVLSGVILPGTIDLAGSATGSIPAKRNLLTGDRIRDGDAIIFVRSSGIHANGLTLARKVATTLKEGYKTIMDNGRMFGDLLLTPTPIYVPLIREIQSAGIPVHYAVNITGHGWRKLMRAEQHFTYIVEKIPKPQEIFGYIREFSGCTDREMYATFNMGAGFALYAPIRQSARIIRAAEETGFSAWIAGHVEKGDKSVLITQKQLTYSADTLDIR